jgi:hypothetical protein
VHKQSSIAFLQASYDRDDSRAIARSTTTKQQNTSARSAHMQSHINSHIEFLFPAFCYALREPDPSFQKEWAAVDELGFPWHVYEFEALIAGNFERAFRFLKPGGGQTLLYRGWILKETEYRRLEQELGKRGYRLFTGTRAYALTAYLPNYHEKVRALTPPAVWSPGKNFHQAWRKAQELGPSPYIIKDYVKSAKELWDTACYIPPGVSEPQFIAACKALVAFLGDRFQRGVVVRPFVPPRFLDMSPFGPQPIFEEYRLFFLHGRLLWTSAYDYIGGKHDDFQPFLRLPQIIDSPFFSADIAKTETGEMILIELGDGGVSGLPPTVPRVDFYRKLADLLAQRICHASA